MQTDVQARDEPCGFWLLNPFDFYITGKVVGAQVVSLRYYNDGPGRIIQ